MMKTFLMRTGFILLLSGLSACGGTKMLGESKPLASVQSLATTTDQHLHASLDWVIFRDGPGSWARNVDWDEYLLRIQNLSGDTVEVTDIRVVDSLGTRIAPGHSRSELVKGTRDAKRRYKGEGLRVKAGVSGKVLTGSGLLIASGSSGLGTAALYGGATGLGVAAGVVLLVPTLAIGGVVRGVNNSKVSNQIESRQTSFPVILGHEEERSLDVFFPLTPSPGSVEILYNDARGDHTLIVDTQAALDGLHLSDAAE